MDDVFRSSFMLNVVICNGNYSQACPPYLRIGCSKWLYSIEMIKKISKKKYLLG